MREPEKGRGRDELEAGRGSAERGGESRRGCRGGGGGAPPRSFHLSHLKKVGSPKDSQAIENQKYVGNVPANVNGGSSSGHVPRSGRQFRNISSSAWYLRRSLQVMFDYVI